MCSSLIVPRLTDVATTGLPAAMSVEVETVCRMATGRSVQSACLGKNYGKLWNKPIAIKKN
jgi:hypothetical protein